MPLWLPDEAAPHLKRFMFISCDKAVGAGLSYRPVQDTIKDVRIWRKTDRPGAELIAALDRDKEQELLRKWHETHYGHERVIADGLISN